MMTTAASGWMDVKALELDVTYNVITSGGWNITNLTDWAIVDPAEPPFSPLYVVYTDVDVTSGATTAAETQQFNRQIDFPKGIDHLNKDLGTDGTYGILDKISKLGTALTLQTTNRNKYTTFLKAYSRNASI